MATCVYNIVFSHSMHYLAREKIMLPAETRDRTRELSLVVLLLSYLVDPFVNAFLYNSVSIHN